MKVFRIINVIYFLFPRRFFRYQVLKMYRFVKLISISNIVLLLYNIQCAQIKVSFLNIRTASWNACYVIIIKINLLSRICKSHKVDKAISFQLVTMATAINC